MTLAADLPVETAIGFEKTLVPERPVQEHFAVGTDLGRSDHRGQYIFQLIVEIAGYRVVQDPVQREAATEQQNHDPCGRNADHPAAKRAGGLCA